MEKNKVRNDDMGSLLPMSHEEILCPGHPPVDWGWTPRPRSRSRVPPRVEFVLWHIVAEA